MRRVMGLLLGAAIAGVFAACGVDRQMVAVEPAPDASSQTPVFEVPDAGVDVDAAESKPLLLCASSECPRGWATCPVDDDGTLPPYACGTNLSEDVDNCGACGHHCRGGTAAYHLDMGCSAGQCQAFCETGFVDCNGIPDDGCESEPLADPKNCGACGIECPAGVACIHGACGCPPGQIVCDGLCTDIHSDDANCGGCGIACIDHQPEDAGALPPNMFYACNAGKCSEPRCYHDSSSFWANCDGDLEANGCEIDLLSPDEANCGKCGNVCKPDQTCIELGGSLDCQCKAGETYCPSNGRFKPARCSDLDSAPTDCGACNYACPVPANAAATCEHGRCGMACKPNMADCNARTDDGCEVDLNKDPSNCGGCGITCDVANGQPCVDGHCVTTPCDAGAQPQ